MPVQYKSSYGGKWHTWAIALVPYLASDELEKRMFTYDANYSYTLPKNSLPKTLLCPSTNFSICTAWNSSSLHLGYAVGHYTAGNSLTLIKHPTMHLFCGDSTAGGKSESAEGHYRANGGTWFLSTASLLEEKYPNILGLKHRKKSNILFVAGNVRPLDVWHVSQSTTDLPWGWTVPDYKINPRAKIIPGL